MKLNEKEIALIKGALWAIGNDMTEGYDENWFDDIDPNSREEFEMADEYNDRNGHKLCEILRQLLDDNDPVDGDPVIYSANYYASNVCDKVGDYLTDDGVDIRDVDIKAITFEIIPEVSHKMTSYDEYPKWEEFCDVVREVLYSHYKIEDGKVISL